MGSPEAVYYDRSLDRTNRYTLFEWFKKLPALNAVIGMPGSDTTSPTAAALAAYTIANRDFEILGTNAVTADVTWDTAGGIILKAHSTTNDYTVLLPHLDTNQTPWTATLWDTAKAPSFETAVVTSTSVASQVIYAGYKLTNTPTEATDNDQAYFSFDTGSANSATRWIYNYAIGGVHNNIVVPQDIIGAVAVSTFYRLRIETYADRTHMGFINDRPIGPKPFSALTSLTTFIPYVGVKSLTTAAKQATVKYIECGRNI